MDRETLCRLQRTQLKILKEIKRVCDWIAIPYFLDWGTLLGAVRHGGFIPWDDDLDVGMTREHYEAFLRLAPALLGEEVFLQTWHSDADYGLPFAKLRLKGTVFAEEVSAGSGAMNGIFVDIFPYDVFPAQEKDRRWQGRRFELLRRMILVKCRYSPWAAGGRPALKKLLYLPLKLSAAVLRREKLIERFEAVTKRFNNEPSGLLFPSGTDNYGTAVVDGRLLTELAPIRFEDDFYLAPKDADAYLTALYGDYMTPPPEDQRENRHQVLVLSFGAHE